MNDGTDAFDLVLSYPQWQGSGRPQNLRRGAIAAADVCQNYGPVESISDAGEGAAKGGINRWTAIVEQFLSAQTILSKRRPRRVLTAGGDCACDIAVIDYLNRTHPSLTVLWVDAHLDANTVETTPSGNFHGMPVASILGSAPQALRGYLAEPLLASQFRYVGAHVGDPGDWSFQRAHDLAWFGLGDAISGPVHIHFDLDALRPSEFPHVAYPDGKLSLQAALELVQDVSDTACLVGLTITEFAPASDEAAAEGSVFLRQLCDAARPSSMQTI